MIDKQLLLAWLRVHSTTKQPLVGAVYAGLIARIMRGDFDSREEESDDVVQG